MPLHRPACRGRESAPSRRPRRGPCRLSGLRGTRSSSCGMPSERPKSPPVPVPTIPREGEEAGVASPVPRSSPLTISPRVPSPPSPTTKGPPVARGRRPPARWRPPGTPLSATSRSPTAPRTAWTSDARSRPVRPRPAAGLAITSGRVSPPAVCSAACMPRGNRPDRGRAHARQTESMPSFKK